MRCVINNIIVDGIRYILYSDNTVGVIGLKDPMEQVVIPPSITTPENAICKVTSIEIGAFDGCKRITSINIPDSVTSIKDWAFMWCKSLTSITIPDSVIFIGYRAFESCINLTEVTLSDNIISIENDIFNDCRNLRDIYFDGNVNLLDYEYRKLIKSKFKPPTWNQLLNRNQM